MVNQLHDSVHPVLSLKGQLMLSHTHPDNIRKHIEETAASASQLMMKYAQSLY